ncbi:MAG: glycosyltransferase family 2 protein [Sulfitobacter sp.]|nr:glycosyltransferase family 2 protein [Sulfitobacter sp.]
MTQTRAPRLLVIILNYRTPQMTLRAVEAALADLPKAGEIVLIDNASADGSAEVLLREIAAHGWDEGGKVRFVQSPVNGGFGAGNNIGLKSAMSDGAAPDYFYLLNSDAFPDPGCITTLLDHLENTPKAGMAGSHVRGDDGLDHITAFRFPSIGGEFEGAARIGPISRIFHKARVAPDLPHQAAQVDWVAGASVMMRARMLEEIGHFDETFFLYFEETDLCLRAARAGWDCWYLPRAGVVHIGSVSTGMKEWRRIPSFWLESRQHYFVKNHGRLYAAAALTARLAGGALHRLRCALTGRPVQDPPYLMRDLLRFGLGLTPGAVPAPRHRPATEDRT